MASLQERAGTYRVIFKFHGNHYFVMVGKVSAQEAESKTAQIEHLLMRLKHALIELPARAFTSLSSSCTTASRPYLRRPLVPAARRSTLAALCDRS